MVCVLIEGKCKKVRRQAHRPKCGHVEMIPKISEKILSNEMCRTSDTSSSQYTCHVPLPPLTKATTDSSLSRPTVVVVWEHRGRVGKSVVRGIGTSGEWVCIVHECMWIQDSLTGICADVCAGRNVVVSVWLSSTSFPCFLGFFSHPYFLTFLNSSDVQRVSSQLHDGKQNCLGQCMPPHPLQNSPGCLPSSRTLELCLGSLHALWSCWVISNLCFACKHSDNLFKKWLCSIYTNLQNCCMWVGHLSESKTMCYYMATTNIKLLQQHHCHQHTKKDKLVAPFVRDSRTSDFCSR